MITISRTKDRIPVKVGPIEFTISPLSQHQKRDVQSVVVNKGGDTITDALLAAEKCIKYQVKGVKGIQCLDGKPYELDFENDVLTDDCVSDIMGLEQKDKLAQFFFKVLHEMKDPGIKGVEVILPGSKRKNVKR